MRFSVILFKIHCSQCHLKNIYDSITIASGESNFSKLMLTKTNSANVELQYVFVNFSFGRLLQPLTVVVGKFKNILKAIATLGAMYVK